ncbi:ABC transporter ATP-binding protein [Streptococcus sciuri]|uniref:ATP-binding cassette domain-containing protein n=1 Tax=Streptococcus sciuri TaxID=2973939 RepID=A0ABT2F5R9_9STRE|nr:ATP-binding cassette domain-containing protein [Streptococcus sciuri]MCS4487803.1 ATP-binding cassette domain-containing protein [Streptococcus sciuri]
MIQVEELTYVYKTFEKSVGFWGSLKDFWSRRYKTIAALEAIHFEIEEGECIGLLGANGAGKTTLIKLLTGILTPTSGTLSNQGYTPSLRQKDYLKSIGVVLGQKSQLIWDLPAKETLEMLKVIYEVPQKDYDERLGELCQLLSVSHKLQTPVRSLSLGERMKFELICALIHSPKMLFLDEPTIGLDINSQRTIRHFLKEINRKEKVTILLTSHYMQDIEETCQRVMVLSKGRLLDDLSIVDLKKKYGAPKEIVITFQSAIPDKLSLYKISDRSIKISETSYQSLALTLDIKDIETVTKYDSPFEDIIAALFETDRR